MAQRSFIVPAMGTKKSQRSVPTIRCRIGVLVS
jgi:hypothetical protein